MGNLVKHLSKQWSHNRSDTGPHRPVEMKKYSRSAIEPKKLSPRPASKTPLQRAQSQVKKLSQRVIDLQNENEHLVNEQERLTQELAALRRQIRQNTQYVSTLSSMDSLNKIELKRTRPSCKIDSVMTEHSRSNDFRSRKSSKLTGKPVRKSTQYEVAVLREGTAGLRVARVEVQTTLTQSKDLFGSDQRIRSFKLIDGNIEQAWRTSDVLWLCFKNGTALRVKVAARPHDESCHGMLQLVD